MSEKCPLEPGIHWDYDGSSPIPEVCLIQCGDIWQGVQDTDNPIVDHFGEDPRDCMADMDYAGTTLQRNDSGSARKITTLYECPRHNVEVLNENWKFDCPNN